MASRPARKTALTSGRAGRAATRITEVTTAAQPSPLGLVPDVRVAASADLQREYVSVSGYGFLGGYIRTLPPWIDDVTRDFGTDMYARMRQDAQNESALELLRIGMIAQGLSVDAAVDDDAPEYAQALEITQFVRRVIAQLESPILETLSEMALAMAYGFKAAELIYTTETWDPAIGPQLVLKAIRPKPQTSVGFVTDDKNAVLGLVYLHTGQIMPTLGGIASLGSPAPASGSGTLPTTAPDGTPMLLPRRKFFVTTWHEENGDIRGTSIFRSAYHPFWVKAQVWKDYLAYLATFASPSLIGFTDPDGEDAYRVDSNGVPVATETPEMAMLHALEGIKNGGVAAFPGNAKVQPLIVAGDGRAFLEAINLCDRQITKAVLLQTLATEEGEHMARAASETHQDVLGLRFRQVKTWMSASLMRDVIRPLVEYNYGADAARNLAPVVTLGETEHQDFAQDATALAQLQRAGYLHWSQYLALDTMLGLPTRDMDAQMQEILADRALLIAGLTAQTAGPASGGGGTAGKPSASASGGKKPASGASSSNAASMIAQRAAVAAARNIGSQAANRTQDLPGMFADTPGPEEGDVA